MDLLELCERENYLQLIQHPLMQLALELMNLKHSLTSGQSSSFIPKFSKIINTVLDHLSIKEEEVNELDIFMRHLIIGLIDQVWELQGIYIDFNYQLEQLYPSSHQNQQLNSSESQDLSEENYSISSGLNFTDNLVPSQKPRRKSTRKSNHPQEVIMLLKDWLLNNRDNPYPTTQEKLNLCKQTKLTVTQLNDWFVNARRRILGRVAQPPTNSHYSN